jgi:hypothetical protein
VKKGWKLDINNKPEEYKNEIKQKLATIKQGGNSEEIWKAVKDIFKEVADKTIPRKEKKKWTLLDIPRHNESRGEQAKNENGRKLGRSKKIKLRNTEKN